MKKILLVEDDQSLGISLKEYLESESFAVTRVTNLDSARQVFATDKFDLMVLDWMLPDGQGVDLLKNNEFSGPVIMLTARTELIDRVIGLESGASDYVTKPFEPRELVARIRAQLRGQAGDSSDEFTGPIVRGDIRIDTERRITSFKCEEVYLTKMEFDLLTLLAQKPGRAFSREELLNKVWGFEHVPSTRTVDTHVLQLRQKFGDETILTVRGVGYKFNEDYSSTQA